MTDTNFDQWLELKRPQEHVPLSEHYSELQGQQVYEFAYFLVQNLEDSDNDDQRACPPTPPPSAPSSQIEAAAGSSSRSGDSQETDVDRREADRRSLARLLDMERLEEEQARRARAAAVKKAALPRPRPLPIPIRQSPQTRSPLKQEPNPRGISAPQGQRLPPLRESREPRTPSRRPMTPPVEHQMRHERSQQDSTPPQELSPRRQQNATGGPLFDMIYDAISRRMDEKINSHVEEFASEMQALRNQMKRERALMEDFLKEKFGLKQEDCAKFWDGLNRQLRNNDLVVRPIPEHTANRAAQQPASEPSVRCDSVIQSVEDSIRIKRERREEEGVEESLFVEQRVDGGVDVGVDENLNQMLDMVLDEMLVESDIKHENEEVQVQEAQEVHVQRNEEVQTEKEGEEEEEEEEEEESEEEEAEIQVEDEEDEEDDEDSDEPDDSDDPDYHDDGNDLEKTPPPIEVILGTSRRVPSGVKRKAQELDDDEENQQERVSLKKPAWVQVVSPVPNPHLRQQAKQLLTVRKWYKEGGSRNPVVLE